MSETSQGMTKPQEFARLKNLVRSSRDLAMTFEEMGKILQKCHLTSKIQFQITNGSQVEHYNIAIAKGQSKVQSEPSKNPDFEVLTSAETWWEIASGTLAPLEAMGKGLLRFRGDARLGVRILTHLAGTEGRTQIC
jgi:putative sterol carrier protein